MSYTSLWLIGKDLHGKESTTYHNAFWFCPIVWDALTEKYAEPDPMLEMHSLKKSIICDFDGSVFREVNTAVNRCGNTTDRICWELSLGQIFQAKDKDIVQRAVVDFYKQNKGYDKFLPEAHIIERFESIATDIGNINPEETAYFALHGTSVDDNVECWFTRYDEETDDLVETTIDQYSGRARSDVVVIEGGKIKGFVPMDKWGWR